MGENEKLRELMKITHASAFVSTDQVELEVWICQIDVGQDSR